MSSEYYGSLGRPATLLIFFQRLLDPNLDRGDRAYLKELIYGLAQDTELFSYLSTTNPADVPLNQWTPTSQVVSSATTCFLAMAAIAFTDPPSNLTIPLQCASSFLPLAMRWIPFLDPNHGALQPTDTHLHPLIDIVQVLYTFAPHSPSFREQAHVLCRYIVSMWCYLLAHPEHDNRPFSDGMLRSQALARSILDMLRPTRATLPGRPDATALRSTIREELLHTTGQNSSQILAHFLRIAPDLHDREIACSDEFSAMHWHLKTVMALMQDVFPNEPQSQDAFELAVGLIHQSPCDCVITAFCNLLLSLWKTTAGTNYLVWSLRYDLVGALYDNCSGDDALCACAAIFRYIAARTSSRRVLRALLAGHKTNHLLLADGMTEDGALARDIRETLDERVQLLATYKKRRVCATCGERSAESIKYCPCATVIYCSRSCQKQDWSQHKDSCIWYFSGLSLQPTDDIRSPFDMGFILLQVGHYLMSSKADYLCQRLEALQQISKTRGGTLNDVTVELLLDQFPVKDTLVHTSRISESPSEPNFTLKARVYAHGRLTLVTVNHGPLSTFIDVFKREGGGSSGN